MRSRFVLISISGWSLTLGLLLLPAHAGVDRLQGCYFDSRVGEFMGSRYQEFELLMIERAGDDLLLRGVRSGWHSCVVLDIETGGALLFEHSGTEYVYRNRLDEIDCKFRLVPGDEGFDVIDDGLHCRELFACGARAGVDFSWRYEERLPTDEACVERLPPPD